MTCHGCINMNSPSLQSPPFSHKNTLSQQGDFPIQPFPRARRPALIPQNASFTLAEAEELVRPRINQPLIPPPDPNLIHQLNSRSASTSPDLSPSTSPPSPKQFSSAAQSATNFPLHPFFRQHDTPNTSPHHPLPHTSLPKPNHTRTHYLKARAHYIRDLKRRHAPPHTRAHSLPHIDSPAIPIAAPKRKHSAFLLDEERKCYMEDVVVGTPHLSEMVPGDDVTAQLNVEELRMGESGMLEGGVEVGLREDGVGAGGKMGGST